MVKKLLSSILVFAMLVVPTLAMAEEMVDFVSVPATEIAALSEAEALALLKEAMVDGDTQPLQVALLSLEEMKETEGAWLPLVIKFGPIGLKIAHHAAHHYFPRLGKYLPHIQATMWRVGVKGSDRSWRIPLPSRFGPRR